MSKKSKALVEALSALINQQPFFAVFLYDQLTLHEMTKDEFVAETGKDFPLATDGHRILIQKELFAKYSIPERVFGLCHEVMHAIYQHMSRIKNYQQLGIGPDNKKFNVMKYNVAADFVINAQLVDARVGKMIAGALFDPSITGKELVDDVYCKLPDSPQDNKGSGSGEGDGRMDGHMPAKPGTTPSDTEIKRALKSAAAAAKAQGKLPGNIARMVDELVEPTQDWKELLRSALTNALGKDEPTWRRPNRRKLVVAPHVYLPGTQGFRAGNVAVMIDTSGSISSDELQAFMSETAGILQDGKPERCTVFWVDTKVRGIDDVETPAELTSLTAKGGGGTDLEAALPEMYEYMGDDTVCVILTDGYTSFSPEPPVPFNRYIWVTTGKDEIPYGEVIKMDARGV